MSYDIPEEPTPKSLTFESLLRRPPRMARLPKFAVLTSTDAVAPADRPVCPSCEEAATFWRGPHPSVGEVSVELLDDARTAHLVTGLRKRLVLHRGEKGGGDLTVLVLPISRERAAAELYAYADAPLADRPLYLPHRGAWCWQPALCLRCGESHARAWYEALWPAAQDEAIEKIRRGGGRQRAAGGPAGLDE